MSDEPASSPASIDVAMLDDDWQGCLPGAATLVSRVAAETMARALDGACSGAAIELSLVLTDDIQVRDMNRAHRGQDKPTNVLSFPSLDWELGPGILTRSEEAALTGMPLLLGDVVIARETTLAEASAQGKALRDHLAHLVVHGVLHLLGYDHGTASTAADMEGLEVAILADLGVADPYGARVGNAAAGQP